MIKLSAIWFHEEKVEIAGQMVRSIKTELTQWVNPSNITHVSVHCIDLDGKDEPSGYSVIYCAGVTTVVRESVEYILDEILEHSMQERMLLKIDDSK